jgi:hypothetical protein
MDFRRNWFMHYLPGTPWRLSDLLIWLAIWCILVFALWALPDPVHRIMEAF